MEVKYGRLDPNDFAKFGEIDRSEHILGIYCWTGRELAVERKDFEVAGWYPGEAEAHVARLHALEANGGIVVAATFGETMVGVASLDRGLIPAYPSALKLDVLYVGRPWRGQGVGRRLTTMLGEHAAGLGADSLYISATPTRNTVDAYLRMGAQPLVSPDAQLLSMEPEDIHLLLPLATLRAK